MNTSDIVIIGAGIVGLSIARELKRRHPDSKVTVLEKEPVPGRHSSGRNSGVLHSGIYYPPESLKAKVCRQGAIEMAEYHQSNGIRLDRRGKILVCANEVDGPQLDLLSQRAADNGVKAELLDLNTLAELEPEVRSATGRALLIESTSVGSPAAVMVVMQKEIQALGVVLRTGVTISSIDSRDRIIRFAEGSSISYGHIINAAGLYADKVAHRFGVGGRYTLLPFKGIYWKLDPRSGININHLIYPVPDLRVPFLGVHTTTTTDGATYLGPTAVPAFGRENYYGMNGVTISEFGNITSLLAKQFVNGQDGFRRLAWQEGRRYFKRWFAQAGQAILPRLTPRHLLRTEKVGIRAQMLDIEKGSLVTDFLVERGPNSTHILNAISPAWTSAFPFARYICDNYIERTK